MDTLMQLRVTDTAGKVNRDVVVSECITFYNLHRVLQFCIKPAQTDSTVDGKAFTFEDVKSGKVIKAIKSAQLDRYGNGRHLDVGDSLLYKPAGGAHYLVEAVATGGRYGMSYVPRCVAGNIDVDKVNKKLLTRRFSKAGAGKAKKPPAVWCSRSTPASEIMAGHMAAMRDELA